jgi:predicted membrane protein
MKYNKLSADPTALILGVVSLVIILIGCCCGFLVIISLTLAIVGLVMASKSLREFDADSQNYSIESRNNVIAGKIVCIIGTVLSSLYIVIAVVLLLVYQINFSKVLKEKFDEIKERQEQSSDSIKNERLKDTINIDTDSTYYDSVRVEEIK